MLLGAAQVCDPFLQDRLLVLLDACEGDSHAHIGQDKCDSAERRECGVIVGDADANVRTLRCGIQHVEEASSNTQVAGLGDELCVERNLSYYCLCDEWVAWGLPALGVHSSRLSFVAKAESVVTFSGNLRFSQQVSQSV